MDKNLKRYLEDYNINFMEHKHPAVFTVEESKKLKLCPTGLHTKSLFLKSCKNDFFLVCLEAEKRLDIKSLKKYLNLKKLHFASQEELKSILNLTPGSVSIFGLINDKEVRVSLILDSEIWDADSVGFHPNINTSTLELSHTDLEKFYVSLKNKKQIIDFNKLKNG